MSECTKRRPPPRDIQARRIRWQTGLPAPLARAVAHLAYGEGRT